MTRAERAPLLRRGRPMAAGFTLLELLVVVAILSATAMLGFAFTADQSAQLRQDNTRRALNRIVEAVRGPQGAVWNGQVRLAGFVADNGRLPTSVSELTDRDAFVDSGTLVGWSAHSPLFDPQPDDEGWNDGGEVSLDADTQLLWKGLRRHLEATPGASDYRDGWGNVAIDGDDDSNYGWLFARVDDALTIGSLGADNATGNSSAMGYGDDLQVTLAAEDWSVALAGWSVSVTNATAVDLNERLCASLLVFDNTAGGARWRRYTSACTDAIAAGAQAELAFSAAGMPGTDLSPARIPQGEHLLVLVADSDTTAHNGASDALFLVDGEPVTQRLSFYAGAARPDARVVLR